MSKKYNFGQLAGLILGVTIGAFGVNYAYNKFYLHKNMKNSATTTPVPENIKGNAQYMPGQNTANTQSALEQSLSTPSKNSQNRVYS